MTLRYPVMLFAAGFGTRMGELTKVRPKPLVSVADRPLLDHAIDLVQEASAPRIVVNTHYLGDQIAAHLGGSGITISHETPNILDTGGGLRNALPLLRSETVFTMNTDAVWSGPNPLAVLQSAWDADKMDALLLCLPKENALGHKGQGDFVSNGDNPAQRGPGLIYSGAQIIKTGGLFDVPEDTFSLNVLWTRMIEAKRLYIISYDGHWCDVGHPGGITMAEEMLETYGTI
ncbi:nucleotidyltransferase family protein [Donghicola sp. XS_ASV15]|uniref:nucleotidyltransferase family protein n=1 Tax=Donghicola sp. XS_ASV15 TaxID=3241295 RepID=UPI0035111D63